MKMQQKSRARGSTIFVGIIAAVCIVIYLAALIQGAIRLYLSVEQHRSTAEGEFEYLINIAVSAGTQGFMDERFIEAMTSALAYSKSIEALIISGPEGQYVFERQKGRAVAWVNNSPRFINRYNYSNENYYKPLPIQNLRNANISAVATSFSYTEFSKILKETLFLILIGFTIAFFTMLLQSLLGKTVERERIKPEYTHVTEPVAEPDRKMEREYIQAEREESEPKGLYSPRSNIGWEEYLADRLDSELHRCASTEKDLTLMKMDFMDRLNDIQFKHAAEEAVSFFTSRDLLFESGKRGIAVIYPGFDLETGLAKAQKFHQRIMEKIFYNHKTEKCLCIGLTSRSGRLINAGRMLMEADEALRRAKKDRESPIMAFKSDAEKYREFISKRD
jgi:GGDEF domain-containing protein